MSRTLAEGDAVVFVDQRQRSAYGTLRAGKRKNVRGNLIDYDDVIGQPDGSVVTSKKGQRFHAFAATYREHVLGMQRHAQIVYPKDAALIALWADVFPGATVVEGGLGSGALSMALLRAVGPTGRVITYEKQPEPANRALKNIQTLMGECPGHQVRIGDIYQGIEERDVDRVVLDVPEPWEVVPHAIEALRDGGLFAAYVPTVLQVQRIVLTLKRSRRFPLIDSLEALVRPWWVTGNSVRPEQKMVGHTGFVVAARKGADPRAASEPQADESDEETMGSCEASGTSLA
ncbi:MAG: tRNA (adenine-N1)-methyltransferase [Proteobacteria bacterium]|nr:MAG: tRNA (adenine-N1)-methyltransferase [Pseudomonadota bacterium]